MVESTATGTEVLCIFCPPLCIRFWKLIDETEKLVSFGIAAFKTGQALSNLTTALMRLGVGRATILQYVKSSSYRGKVAAKLIVLCTDLWLRRLCS